LYLHVRGSRSGEGKGPTPFAEGWRENMRQDGMMRREKINLSTSVSMGCKDELVEVVIAKVTCTNPKTLN
jgi:hypothetical protein